MLIWYIFDWWVSRHHGTARLNVNQHPTPDSGAEPVYPPKYGGQTITINPGPHIFASSQ